MKNKLSLNIIVLFIVLNTLTLNPFADFSLLPDGESKQNNMISSSSRAKNISGVSDREKEKKESFFKTVNIKEYVPLRVVASEKWLGMI